MFMRTMTKMTGSIAFALLCTLPAAAGDVGSVFAPPQDDAIEMQGNLEGDLLTCIDSKDQDCQAIFDQVFTIIETRFEQAEGRAINGFLLRKGKKPKAIEFTIEVFEEAEGSVRVISEYDSETDQYGMTWRDPSGPHTGRE